MTFPSNAFNNGNQSCALCVLNYTRITYFTEIHSVGRITFKNKIYILILIKFKEFN